MRTYADCVPCFVHQVLVAARRLTDDPRIHERVLRATLAEAATMAFDRPPPWMGQRIHRRLREETGDRDPYRAAKRSANDLALSLRLALQARVAAAADPFAAAVRLAIAGNIIDLGCKPHVTDEAVHAAIAEALEGELDHGAVDEFREAVLGAGRILYLTDNAGEIVLDRLLIEQMPIARVTLGVRGHPIINDATRDDAEAAGLAGLVRVIDNGSDAPGTILEDCSAEFREVFHSADVVVAKGQGNYETLSEAGRDVFFLLKAKCPVIARDLGCDVGRMILFRGGRGRGLPARGACLNHKGARA